jgi:hypothetical protein
MRQPERTARDHSPPAAVKPSVAAASAVPAPAYEVGRTRQRGSGYGREHFGRVLKVGVHDRDHLAPSDGKAFLQRPSEAAGPGAW